ncbi:hypothetical protein GCM10018987_56960 [Streptomyces cremeus]
MEELPLDQVNTLLAVVDEGTFDAAAAALHVTPSAVSQRIKALEQRTGRVLLMRSKPVRPTNSGQVIVRFARQLALLERGARTELGLTSEPGGATGPDTAGRRRERRFARDLVPALSDPGSAGTRDLLRVAP